jgi:hypothetical protein
MSLKIPLKRTLAMQFAALATNVDGSLVLGKAPFDGNVTAVGFIPNAAITGQDTNTRRVAITNRGSAGLGTTETAFLQFNSGVNAVQYDEKAITLHATVANRAVTEGDVLTIDSTTPGTGLADPGGLYIVEITRLNT